MTCVPFPLNLPAGPRPASLCRLVHLLISSRAETVTNHSTRSSHWRRSTLLLHIARPQTQLTLLLLLPPSYGRRDTSLPGSRVLCAPAAGAARRPQVQERPSERQLRHCQGAPSRATARLWLCLPTTAAYASGRLPAAYETTCSSKALQICQTGFTSSLHTFTQMASHHQYRDHLDSQICDVGLSQVLEDRTRNANAKACAQLSC